MVNGRINRIAPSAQLAADRELQQRLLGVGRHGHEDAPEPDARAQAAEASDGPKLVKLYDSNPRPPTRWSPRTRPGSCTAT